MAADGPWRRERRGGNFQGKQCYRIGGVGTGVGGGGRGWFGGLPYGRLQLLAIL